MASIESPSTTPAKPAKKKSKQLVHSWDFVSRRSNGIDKATYVFQCNHCREEKHYTSAPEINISNKLLERLNSDKQENRSYRDIMLSEKLKRK